MNIGSLIVAAKPPTLDVKGSLTNGESDFGMHLEQTEKSLSPFISTEELSKQAQVPLNFHALLGEDEQVNEIESDLLIEDEEEIDTLSSLMTELTIVAELSDEQLDIQEESNDVQSDIKTATEHDEQHVLISQFQQLSEQVHTILTDLDEENIKQLAPKLLQLLRQWAQLGKADASEDYTKLVDEQLPDKDGETWKQLLTSFQKRDNLALTGAYRHDAEVTTEDVSRWLQQALSAQNIQTEESTTVPVTNVSNTSQHVPMSHVEQYVIHINESDRVERVQEQLVRQFEAVMKESRFLRSPQITQLSFTLNPNHLGHVHVQLMEVNGEMTVKMIASSLAAKEMLESNIHQLKHMFAPHNVIVERNETEVDEVNQLEDEQDKDEEQAMHEDEQAQHHESSEEKAEQNTVDFQSVLSQLGASLEGEESNE